MQRNAALVRRRLAALISAMVVLVLIAAYFTWCPRFGHGGATDEEQVAAAALASGATVAPTHVWVKHNYALASWSPEQDQRTEMLFVRKLCRWTLDTRTSVGFDRAALRERGVPARDADALFVLLMEGYAEGP
jgi:transposase